MTRRSIIKIASLCVFAVAMLQGGIAAAQHGHEGQVGHAQEAAVPAQADDQGASDEGHGAAHNAHPIDIDWDALNVWPVSPAPEQAAVDETYPGQHVIVGPSIIGNVVNFILLALVIYFLARKPLVEFLKTRSANVRKGLDEAKKLLDEANAKLADYSQRLERMDDEMKKLRDEFVEAGKQERDRLIADGGRKAERMRKDAETRLKQELAQLSEELRIETTDKAIAAATALVTKQVNDADRKRLADEYIERLEREGLGQ